MQNQLMNWARSLPGTGINLEIICKAVLKILRIPPTPSPIANPACIPNSYNEANRQIKAPGLEQITGWLQIMMVLLFICSSKRLHSNSSE